MILIRRAGILFLVIFFFFTHGLTAQRADSAQKLDTVVADTVVVGGETSPGFGSNIDTSNLAGAGRETNMVSADSAILRSAPDTAVNKWKKNPHFGYANDSAYWPGAKQSPHDGGDLLLRILTSTWFKYFIYILLGGVLLFVIVRVMSENNFGLFYRRARKVAAVSGAAEEPEVEEDLEVLLQRSLAGGDHRLSVRYLYLRSLRGLSVRGLIRPTRQATNHDYLLQLTGNPREPSFRFLTTAYEKVWYGDFPLGESQFQRLYQHFVDFDKTVRP